MACLLFAGFAGVASAFDEDDAPWAMGYVVGAQSRVTAEAANAAARWDVRARMIGHQIASGAQIERTPR